MAFGNGLCVPLLEARLIFPVFSRVTRVRDIRDDSAILAGAAVTDFMLCCAMAFGTIQLKRLQVLCTMILWKLLGVTTCHLQLQSTWRGGIAIWNASFWLELCGRLRHLTRGCQTEQRWTALRQVFHKKFNQTATKRLLSLCRGGIHAWCTYGVALSWLSWQQFFSLPHPEFANVLIAMSRATWSGWPGCGISFFHLLCSWRSLFGIPLTTVVWRRLGLIIHTGRMQTTMNFSRSQAEMLMYSSKWGFADSLSPCPQMLSHLSYRTSFEQKARFWLHCGFIKPFFAHTRGNVFSPNSCAEDLCVVAVSRSMSSPGLDLNSAVNKLEQQQLFSQRISTLLDDQDLGQRWSWHRLSKYK